MSEHQQTQQSKESKPTFQKQATPIIQTPISNPASIIQRARINPKSLSPADVLQLQRTIGNRAVGKLLSEIRNPSRVQQVPIQRQIVPEEEKEPLQGMFGKEPEEESCPSCMQRQEIPEEDEPLQGKMIEPIQLQTILEEEEKPLQRKMFEPVQRQTVPEEEEKLQMKSVVQRQTIPEEDEPIQGKMIGTVQRQEIPEEEEPLQTKRENNTGIPDNLKAGVENLSGIDMSDVRVHYNSSKPSEVGALAYTQGTKIHIAPGQEKHLPHEAWHVVQQAQGRVRPTMLLKGVTVNDDAGLEREADVMGTDAIKLKLLSTFTGKKEKTIQTSKFDVIQRYLAVGVTVPYKTKRVIIHYKEYSQLPLIVKNTVDELKNSDGEKYKEIGNWIESWYIFLRMKHERDKLGLKKSADQALVQGRTLLTLNPGDRVYGYGMGPNLPKTKDQSGQIGRERGKPIQDTLNNTVIGKGGKKCLLGDEAAEYAEFLETSKYRPSGSRAKGEPWKTPSPNFAKLCKAGLIFHTKSRKEPVLIHFDISGMDMFDVVTKGGDRGDIITFKELRSIYRQYLIQMEKIAGDIDLNRIKFYFMGKPVDPPWIADPELWALYKPKLRIAEFQQKQSEHLLDLDSQSFHSQYTE